MARILGIDYGMKKCGVSATDSMQIIVSAIGTVPTLELLQFLKNYIQEERVEKNCLWQANSQRWSQHLFTRAY